MTVAAIQAGTIRKRSRTIARPLRVHLSPPEGREFFCATNTGYPVRAQGRTCERPFGRPPADAEELARF
jgi:hypothetical protein